MGEKVTLVRPDGTTLNVPSQDVDKYRALDYRPESGAEGLSRNIEASKEEHYTSAGQKVITGLEGVASGLTLGGSTLLFGDEEEAERARYNPGTRLGTEVLGAVAPSLLNPASAAGSIARLTPAGLAFRGGQAAARATTSTRVAGAVVSGAVEGAAFSGAAAATTARLNGDPITAEAVLAGVGWGALFGGALSGVATKAGVTFEKMAADKRIAAEVAEGGLVPVEQWNTFRASIADAQKTASRAVREATEAIVKEAPESTVSRVMAHVDEVESAQSTLFNEITAKGKWNPISRQMKSEMLSLRKQAAIAAKEPGGFSKFEPLIEKHSATMRNLAKATDTVAPELTPFVIAAEKTGAKAIADVQGLKAVSEILDNFPSTPQGFAAMGAKKMEQEVASINRFLKGDAAELSGVREAVKQTIDDMVSGAGLAIEGTPGEKLQGLWGVMRAAKKAAKDGNALQFRDLAGLAVGYEAGEATGAGGAAGALAGAAVARKGGFVKGIARYGGGRAGSQIVGKAGGGPLAKGIGFGLGAKVVGGLADLKGAVLGSIADKAASWGPGVAKAVTKAVPHIDPLRVRLDGTTDAAKASRKQLMAARAKEIRNAAPTIRDSLYKAVEPLTAEHSALALQMNKAAVAMFDQLMMRLPRDPGTAFANMKSMWSPDFIATEQFARAYEVFHNPVGTAVKWLQNPKTITPEGARALKEMNPELWTHLRVEMLNRLSQPGVLEKMSYPEQIGIGTMLDLRIHSTQDPRFIKAQQEMFSERNQPLPARPSASSNNSNNPSGVGSGATSAQRITEH